MKTNIIEKLDEIQKQKKLPKESKEKIKNIFTLNLIISDFILFYFIAVQIATKLLDKNLVQNIYHLFAFISLFFVFVLFEISYKKSSEKYFLYGLEILSISIISLFVPYIFLKNEPTTLIKCAGVFYTFYFLVKSIIMSFQEKRMYLKTKNDISEIIKKESQDKMSIAYLNELAQKKTRKTTKKSGTKKRGRPRKNTKKE